MVPNAPVSLQNNLAVTLATQIGLTWVDGTSSGGVPIIDYQIWYDSGILNSNLIQLVTGLTTKSYTATGLTEGTTYVFKVAARNSVGVSPLSEQVSVLAA